jgi:hypothetical protein
MLRRQLALPQRFRRWTGRARGDCRYWVVRHLFQEKEYYLEESSPLDPRNRKNVKQMLGIELVVMMMSMSSIQRQSFLFFKFIVTLVALAPPDIHQATRHLFRNRNTIKLPKVQSRGR